MNDVDHRQANKAYRTFELQSLQQLHLDARDIFEHGLIAVNPTSALQTALTFDGSVLNVSGEAFDLRGRPVYAIAIGKAAASMATGLDRVLRDALAAGVLSGPRFNSSKWQTFTGGHPSPNEQSLAAAQAAFQLLDRANNERAIVVALVSGGGSAMLEWPTANDITLHDLQTTNRVLVNCGASINEVNIVRRAFSAVKGGGLVRRAPNASFITLIVSDTNKGDEASVASGPTIPAVNGTRAAEIIERYKLASKLPLSIFRAITTADPHPQTSDGLVHVLLDNETAVTAAAARASSLGFNAVIANDISEQQIVNGCEMLLEQLRTLDAPACLLSGGEFSCPVRGEGVGGRNSETALRCAMLLDHSVAGHASPEQTSDSHQHDGARSATVILSAGTDGIDGNSPAAGAIADSTTVNRAHSLGLSAEDFLQRSDSFSFFDKLSDAIVIGPTGTNVRDLRILLKK